MHGTLAEVTGTYCTYTDLVLSPPNIGLVFTFVQDENVPWYANEKWDFVKGNLSSVDRNYGWAHNLVHNIGTHQVRAQAYMKIVLKTNPSPVKFFST